MVDWTAFIGFGHNSMISMSQSRLPVPLRGVSLRFAQAGEEIAACLTVNKRN